ncbi:actin family [Blyttiomyces helicus]|uniref:Actin family n=1 Tax=Blyttiomyces helicus TaxID=388810 RepID=A0A4P9WIQ9_9FUNG|nr:actin family [Blyttiomyces helicus]|eukprot:RKO91905.1 actin family [Blyttiomyces helicus]
MSAPSSPAAQRAARALDLSTAAFPSSSSSIGPSLSSASLSFSSSTSSLRRQGSLYVSSDSDRVVLDIGSRYVRCGFSGESKPRHVLPCGVPVPYSTAPEGCRSGIKDVKNADGERISLRLNNHRLSVSSQHCPTHQLELDHSSLEHIKNMLTDQLRAVFHNYLLTDSKARKVIVCEGPLMPRTLKRIIVSILFDTLQVPAISFAPMHLLALLTVGKTTGLVIDCGNLETSVLPIYDGRPLFPNIQTIPLAGDAITTRLKYLVRHHAHILRGSSRALIPVTDAFVSARPPEFWETLKAQVCVVGAFEVQPSAADGTFQSVLPEARYPVDATDRLVLPGWVRERAAEVLFEGDEDRRSIATVVWDAILKCPADIRTDLAANILLVGGTAMMPGLTSRLKEELLTAVEHSHSAIDKLGHYDTFPARYAKLRRLAPRLRFADTTFMANCAAWIGGSLAGSLRMTGAGVTREAWEAAAGVLPDR